MNKRDRAFVMRKVYDSYISGDKLSDADLLLGVKHYKDMADMLFDSGPAFSIVAKEANRVYQTLDGFARARGLA